MCAQAGQFGANQGEISTYVGYFKGDRSIMANGLKYRGAKYMVLQATDETVLAMHQKEAIVMERSNRLFVVGYTSDVNALPAQTVSAGVSKVVHQLKQVNY